ncbi:CPBP family intramembrane metalloprotease [Luteimonas sp. SX5]|uniref:CPBP family intramembrane metalloprotease n=1 Tax=Luteimonas galliterrae TaxID=2940486 RepID=A0ABT0MK56_9GAMM|nr:CPBP family intramembrane glutamic endopeptidase [Luteimonas galliterrae]MCL1635262.1 CPBP family intramembrane metalloprotease [Luteimonas galliterrae]
MMTDAVLSALVNLVLLAGLPLFGYYLYHRLRHKRGFGEIARRAGLQLGEKKYLIYSVLSAAACVGLLLAWRPALDSFTGATSPQRTFVGLGMSAASIAMALLYGMVKTGFSEEFLFRGLIAGSLSRRMPLLWANVLQALIFLAPHLLILLSRPALWPVLPAVFVGGLLTGWLRIKSGSIIGPWLIHGALNTATCLYVAAGTAP